MIKIDITKEKKLQFTLSFTGRFQGEISAYFRIYFKDFNIGFDAKINDDQKIIVNLPPLVDYVKTLKTDKARATVEIISGRDIFLAWKDDVEFKNIRDVKASLVKEITKRKKIAEEIEVKKELIAYIEEEEEEVSSIQQKQIPQSEFDFSKISNLKAILSEDVVLSTHTKDIKNIAARKNKEMQNKNRQFKLADKIKSAFSK